ncbi:MAG TPA: MurR/RpiR family transcriptional regulator [Acidimicrobiales bacterium]|nr:MurR/RpiR family transcriptional regulator [Acidimicrobiales bacterium]
MSEVAERIAQHRDDLSPAERQVAEVVLRHPEGIAFGTVAEVAAVADTSGASVVRLATRLGYRGFSDLQGSVRATMGQQLRPAVERIRATDASDPADVLARTQAAEVANVQRTLDAIDPAAFGRALGLLADETRPVRVLAGDAEAGIGTMLAANLSMLRADVAEVTGSPVAVARQLGPLAGPLGAAPAAERRALVLVAVDLRRYERWVVEAAARAAAGGAALVAVTDSPLSPLAASAEVTFAVAAEGAGPFDSHVGTLALVNALVTGVAARLRRSATDRLDELEARWREAGALLDP